VVVGEHALAEERGGHREVEALREPHERVAGGVPADAGAGQHDHVLGLPQQLRRALHLTRVGRGIDGRVHAERLAGRDVLGHVLGHDDEGGAGSLRRRLLERLAHHLGRGGGHGHHVAPLRDRTEQADQIHELMRLLVDPAQGGLRGDRDQRMRVELGVRHAEHQVDRPGSQRRQADPRRAREGAVRVGHERRAALVARGDEADRRFDERVDHAQVLLAGEPEHVLDALVLQALDDLSRDGAGGGGGHRTSPQLISIIFSRTA
jgi:hypothetical protein